MASLSDFVYLTDIQHTVLKRLSDESVFYQSFYFTGGTALKALGIVPRESNDLDFFTFSQIDQRSFPSLLVQLKAILTDELEGDRLIDTDKGFLDKETGMSIDFILDHIPSIDTFTTFGQLNVSGFKDIAANKASALCCRDEVKDYIDIAFLTRSMKWTLAHLEEFAQAKFQLGTITEEKLVEELLSKKEMFTLSPDLFLFEGRKHMTLVNQQIDLLLSSTTL